MIIYLYKENNRMGLAIKDGEIVLFNKDDKCIEVKESELHDLLEEYFNKHF